MPLPASSGSPRGWRGGEARPTRHAQAAEGSEVSPGRAGRPHAPWGGRDPARPARAADAHSARSPSSGRHPLGPPRRPGLPAPASRPPRRHPREDGEGRGAGAAGAAPPRRAAKAEGRPEGRAPARGTGSRGGHRADPRPRHLPVQAAAVKPAPHLISRRVRAAAPGTNQCSSLAAGRDAGAAAPHTIPARLPACPCVPEPAWDSPSRAAVLRSNQAALPPLSSALLYLLRSLPRSLAPTYLLISLRCLSRPHPPLHLRPQMGGNGQSSNRKKGSAPPRRPLPLPPPTAGTREEVIQKKGRGWSDSQINQSVSAKGVGLELPFLPAPFPEGVT